MENWERSCNIIDKTIGAMLPNYVSTIIFSIRKSPVSWVVFTYYHIIISILQFVSKIFGQVFYTAPRYGRHGQFTKNAGRPKRNKAVCICACTIE